MKKVLFVLILFLSCYIIYHINENNKIYYAVVGDYLFNDLSFLKEKLPEFNNSFYYDDTFIDHDYRITDILKMLNYNETKNINGNNVSINRVLKKSDILIISLGMNELNYKFTNSNGNIYSYMNDMINDMEELFIYIDKFNYKNVYIMGYYDIYNNEDEINYINTKLSLLCDKYDFIYIDLSKSFNNNPMYFDSNYMLNKAGYLKISQIIVEKLKNT